MDTGKDKVKRICEAIKEMIEPSKREAEEIVEAAVVQAEKILSDAKGSAEKILACTPGSKRPRKYFSAFESPNGHRQEFFRRSL